MPVAFLERETKVQSKKETSFTFRSLEDEIAYLQVHWRTENLPSNWDELPGTGFWVKSQVELIFSELFEGDTSELRREKLQKGTERTRIDVKAFALEYLAEGLAFPIHYRKEWIDGRFRVFDPLYKKLMVDTVSEEERGGSVKKTLAEKVEPFLLEAPNRSIAVMISPSGWTGMKGNDGKLITYPDSQTYIWQKMGNDFFGFTIKTDFEHKEHRELLKRLSFGQTIIPENSSVCSYVEGVVGIIPVGQDYDIKDIIQVIQKVRKDLSGGSDRVFEDREWEEVYQNLERREELWNFGERVNEMIEEFEEYVLSAKRSKKEVQTALAVTILRISKFLRGKQLLKTVKEQTYSREFYYPDVSYGKVLSHVQEIPGCAGGGGRATLVNSITLRRAIENSHSSECKKIKCGNPECDWEASDVEAEKVQQGEITCCPKCGWKPS